MAKIIDLAINSIPSEPPPNVDPDIFRYWMSIFPPKSPNKPKPPKPKPKPKPKTADEPIVMRQQALPDDAVVLMRQALQQRIKRHDIN